MLLEVVMIPYNSMGKHTTIEIVKYNKEGNACFTVAYFDKDRNLKILNPEKLINPIFVTILIIASNVMCEFQRGVNYEDAMAETNT